MLILLEIKISLIILIAILISVYYFLKKKNKDSTILKDTILILIMISGLLHILYLLFFFNSLNQLNDYFSTLGLISLTILYSSLSYGYIEHVNPINNKEEKKNIKSNKQALVNLKGNPIEQYDKENMERSKDSKNRSNDSTLRIDMEDLFTLNDFSNDNRHNKDEDDLEELQDFIRELSKKSKKKN